MEISYKPFGVQTLMALLLGHLRHRIVDHSANAPPFAWLPLACGLSLRFPRATTRSITLPPATGLHTVVFYLRGSSLTYGAAAGSAAERVL